MELFPSSRAPRERVRDRFTSLPDDVASKILSLVTFKDSARVGCVSKRCRDFYLCIWNLDFDSAYANYVWDRLGLLNQLDRFLFQRGHKEIKIFRICWMFERGCERSKDERFRVLSWLKYAVKCNLQSLSLKFGMFGRRMTLELPSCIFQCKSLRHLALEVLWMCPFSTEEKILKTPSLDGSSNFLSLKLKNVAIEESFGKWISCCCKCIKELSLEQIVMTERIVIESSSLESFTLVGDDQMCFSDHLKLSVINISGERLETIRIQWKIHSRGIDYFQIFAPNVKVLILAGIFQNYVSLGKLMCLEQSELEVIGIHDFDKAFEFLCSVSRSKYLTLRENIIQVVFREGSVTPRLDNVQWFSLLGMMTDNLVPSMANLLKAMPNLINLSIRNALIHTATNSSAFNISYWKSLNLAFVDHIEQVSITIFNGDNEVEFAAYLLENARNLKNMDIYHSGQHDHEDINWLAHKRSCYSTANVRFWQVL